MYVSSADMKALHKEFERFQLRVKERTSALAIAERDAVHLRNQIDILGKRLDAAEKECRKLRGEPCE